MTTVIKKEYILTTKEGYRYRIVTPDNEDQTTLDLIYEEYKEIGGHGGIWEERARIGIPFKDYASQIASVIKTESVFLLSSDEEEFE